MNRDPCLCEIGLILHVSSYGVFGLCIPFSFISYFLLLILGLLARWQTAHLFLCAYYSFTGGGISLLILVDY